MIMRTSGQRSSADHLTRTLDQSPSTISRDVPRFAVWTDRPACAADNTCGHGARATAPRAERQRFKCRKRFKQVTDTVLFGAVLRSLAHGWSLWQLVKPIHPDEPRRIVSQESVCNCIYVMLRGRYPIASLRRPRSKRIPPSRGEDHREQTLGVHLFPHKGQLQSVSLSQGGDHIKSRGTRSAGGVLLERSARLVMLIKHVDACAASALKGVTAKLVSIAEPDDAPHFDPRPGKQLARRAQLSAHNGACYWLGAVGSLSGAAP